jgi:hypothetical protein
MATADAIAIRHDVDALRRVVDEAVDRLPAAELATLHELVKRTLDEARLLEASHQHAGRRGRPGLVPVHPTPEQRTAYFPVASALPPAVGRREMAESDRGWAVAFERGKRYRDAALREVGPVLTPAEVAARLGVSAVTVNNWRRRKRLLAFRFDAHQYLYPAFQFVDHPEHGERGVMRHLDDVLARLPFRSEWQRVQFFLAPLPALAGNTPLDVLRSGDERRIERLREIAEHAGEMGT